MIYKLSVAAFFSFFIIPCVYAADVTLIPFGATWKYLDNGSDQGTAWRQPSFSDSGWKSGPAELGYGDGDEDTVISYGSNSKNKYITYYFRHSFQVTDKSALGDLKLRLKRDDGAVVYINGTEVFRSNMPTGTITYTTRASGSSGTTVDATFGSSSLVNGTNLIAVEVHQVNPGSTDVSFDLRLLAAESTSSGGGGTSGDGGIVRGPYIQLAGPKGMTIRWKTDAATSSRVRYSTSSSSQNSTKDDATLKTDHAITLTGLRTATRYYYTVGTTQTVLSPRYSFYTPPDNGHPYNTRIWVAGDSGASTTNAARVRDAYSNYTGTRYTNLMLFLGGNAYDNGTDSEYQSGFFDVFKNLLAASPSVSTLSEQEGSTYFNVFTLPVDGIQGGYRSNTEKYYSFNFGTIHVVVLDSATSSRSSSGSMLNWLDDDLSRNHQPWIIAIWHHAPYSKGNHDSDQETAMIEMRQNANQLLENYGVDLVLSAHSNSYERSYFIDGHYGQSTTFNSGMLVDGGNGNPGGDGEYQKPAGSTNSGAVYAVMGSSSTNVSGSFNHPAMRTSQNRLGSMVVDVNCTRMDVRFIRDDGSTGDYFVVRKQNVAPAISIVSPANGTQYSGPASFTVTAEVNDPDSHTRRVRFFRNSTHIGTDYSKPYTVSVNNLGSGTYDFTAIAEDILCTSRTSSAVRVTVK